MYPKKEMPELQIRSDGLTYELENWDELDRYARDNVLSYAQGATLARAWAVSKPDELRLIISCLLKDLVSLRELHIKYVEQMGPLPITTCYTSSPAKTS